MDKKTKEKKLLELALIELKNEMDFNKTYLKHLIIVGGIIAFLFQHGIISASSLILLGVALFSLIIWFDNNNTKFIQDRIFNLNKLIKEDKLLNF